MHACIHYNHNHITSIEEDGEDGDGSEEGEQVLSRFSIFALTINFIIGVGVLDLPFIFYQAGLLLCGILVVLSTLGSNLAANYVLESQARGIMRGKEGADSALDAVDHWYKLEMSELCEIFVGGWFKYVLLVHVHVHVWCV